MFNPTPIALTHTNGGDAGICKIWIHRWNKTGINMLHNDMFANGAPNILNQISAGYIDLNLMDEISEYFPSAVFSQKSKETDAGQKWLVELKLTKGGDAPTLEDIAEIFRYLQNNQWIVIVKLATGRAYYIGSSDAGADAIIDYSSGSIKGNSGNESDIKFEWESPSPCIEIIL